MPFVNQAMPVQGFSDNSADKVCAKLLRSSVIEIGGKHSHIEPCHLITKTTIVRTKCTNTFIEYLLCKTISSRYNTYFFSIFEHYVATDNGFNYHFTTLSLHIFIYYI